MPRFLLLHIGFEPPTPEIMTAWTDWFADVAPLSVDQGGLIKALEISHDGSRPLPMDRHAVTGYTILDAETREAAEQAARANPFIEAVRVYEIRSH